jgi:cbb3-type cytochrome oxidase subunit 3
MIWFTLILVAGVYHICGTQQQRIEWHRHRIDELQNRILELEQKIRD